VRRSSARLLCGILCAAAVCIAQSGPPRLQRKVEPEYSEEARQARLEGEVLLKVMVGTDGKASDLQVIRGLGLGLDENAVAAVSAWQFDPAMRHGEPVSARAQIEVNFRLLDNAGWHVARAEFHLPEGASRPVLETAEGPESAADADRASVTMAFDIDEIGVPVNLQIEVASDEKWARDVTAALREWKFTPAHKDGIAVSVPCTMDFVRGSFMPTAPPGLVK
jgi:TonB family protein